MSTLFHERTPFDILFKNFFQAEGKFQPTTFENKQPHPLDIFYDDDGLNFEIACTGLTKKDIQLKIDGDFIRAVIVLAQMNTHIWVNEDNARSGDNVGNQLMLTHGLNGIRNTAKNKIQEVDGGRKDYKIDCIASEFKDWEVSWNEK